MTAQHNDTLTYEGRTFAVTSVSREPLFDPLNYGFSPISTTTGCHRGHECRFAIDKCGIALDTLWINHGVPIDSCRDRRLPMPELNGVMPNESYEAEYRYFHGRYDNLNLRLDYTGYLLISSDNTSDEGYVHGYPWPWHFHFTLQLRFEHGVLLDRRDVSDILKVFDARYCTDGYLFGDKRPNGRRYLTRHFRQFPYLGGRLRRPRVLPADDRDVHDQPTGSGAVQNDRRAK